MAEAHSWHKCNSAALLSYSWAYDKLSQCIDRCHRLNSEKDLNFYAILCDGSMDRKMEQNLQEKGDTSDLVLDGHLLGENPAEMNLGELMRIAIDEFRTETKTVDETVIEAEWPDLKHRLREAAEAWHRPGGVSESADGPVGEKPANEPTNIIVLPSTPVQETPTARIRGWRGCAGAYYQHEEDSTPGFYMEHIAELLLAKVQQTVGRRQPNLRARPVRATLAIRASDTAPHARECHRAALYGGGHLAFAQVSMSGRGYSQDFGSLGTSGTIPWTNGGTLAGCPPRRTAFELCMQTQRCLQPVSATGPPRALYPAATFPGQTSPVLLVRQEAAVHVSGGGLELH